MLILFSWLLATNSFQVAQFKDVFLSAFLSQGRESAAELSAYFTEKILPRIEQEQLIYAASDASSMVGFVIFEKWEEQVYYLAEMAILPEYQRLNIGKKLVFSILAKDPTTQKIVLMTEEANKSAQLFYEKIGFKHSSFQHPNYPVGFMGYEFCRSDYIGVRSDTFFKQL